MNCLDYRRELLAEGRESEPMRLHRVGCDACAELQREQAAFEGELRRALEVPVPGDLAERLSQGARSGAPHAARRRLLAAAAAAAAIAAVGAGVLLWRGRDDPMAMACIDFVMKDEAKSIMMGAMPREEAKRMLAGTLPLERIERLGQVKHIAPCPFGAGTAYHVILIVPQDKVTLLVMPDTPMDATRRAAQHGMHAAVMPAGKGSVGVVGTSAALVESVVGALRA
jgi:hypothetical protein